MTFYIGKTHVHTNPGKCVEILHFVYDDGTLGLDYMVHGDDY